MRIVLGEVIDFSEPFIMDKLTIKEKFIGMFAYLSKESTILKMSVKREEQEELAKREMIIKQVTKTLAAQIVIIFRNPFKTETGLERVKQQILTVNKYSEVLPEVIKNEELKHYDISLVKIDPDILISFPKIKRQLLIQKQAIGG